MGYMRSVLCMIWLISVISAQDADQPEDWIDLYDMIDPEKTYKETEVKSNIRKSESTDHQMLIESVIRLYNKVKDGTGDVEEVILKKFESYLSIYKEHSNVERSELATCETKLSDLIGSCQKPIAATEQLEMIYFKQYISTLLRHFHHNVDEGDYLTYNAEIVLQSKDIHILRQYADTEAGNVQDTHHVLGSMIQHVELVNETTIFGEDSSLFKVLISDDVISYLSVTLQVFSIITLILASLYIMIHVGFSFKVLIQLFIVLFFISIPWTWWNLYKTQIAEQQAVIMKAMPEHCHGKKEDLKQSLWTYLKATFSFTDDPCVEYYKKLLVNPMFEVSPIQAFAVTLSKCVLEPVQYIGQAIGKLISETLRELPVQLWPVALGILIFIISLVLTMSFGYKIRVFPFINIEPGRRSPVPQLPSTTEQQCLQSRVQDLTRQVEQLSKYKRKMSEPSCVLRRNSLIRASSLITSSICDATSDDSDIQPVQAIRFKEEIPPERVENILPLNPPISSANDDNDLVLDYRSEKIIEDEHPQEPLDMTTELCVDDDKLVTQQT